MVGILQQDDTVVGHLPGKLVLFFLIVLSWMGNILAPVFNHLEDPENGPIQR